MLGMPTWLFHMFLASGMDRFHDSSEFACSRNRQLVQPTWQLVQPTWQLVQPTWQTIGCDKCLISPLTAVNTMVYGGY